MRAAVESAPGAGGDIQGAEKLECQGAAISAGTRREEGQLLQLQEQQQERAARVGQAQKHVTLCLRQVEKIQELSELLMQEPI